MHTGMHCSKLADHEDLFLLLIGAYHDVPVVPLTKEAKIKPKLAVAQNSLKDSERAVCVWFQWYCS